MRIIIFKINISCFKSFSYLNDSSDLKAPKQNDVFEASERMIFLQEKLELLKLQRDKLKDLLVMKAKKAKDLKQKKSQIIYSEKEIENSLKEACFQLNDHLRVKPVIRDHKDLVEEITLKLDFKRDFNSWIQQSVEDLSLESGDEQKLVDNFLLTLHQKLKTLHEQLMMVAKELNKIKEYYLVEVKNEFEIRSGLKKLIDEIKEAHEEEHHTKDNRKQIARKRDLLSMKPGQLFTKYDHSEQDELELLTENLKKKIEILADDSFAYSLMNNTMRH